MIFQTQNRYGDTYTFTLRLAEQRLEVQGLWAATRQVGESHKMGTFWDPSGGLGILPSVTHNDRHMEYIGVGTTLRGFTIQGAPEITEAGNGRDQVYSFPIDQSHNPTRRKLGALMYSAVNRNAHTHRHTLLGRFYDATGGSAQVGDLDLGPSARNWLFEDPPNNRNVGELRTAFEIIAMKDPERNEFSLEEIS